MKLFLIRPILSTYHDTRGVSVKLSLIRPILSTYHGTRGVPVNLSLSRPHPVSSFLFLAAEPPADSDIVMSMQVTSTMDAPLFSVNS